LHVVAKKSSAQIIQRWGCGLPGASNESMLVS
jgi:hypothetical protein